MSNLPICSHPKIVLNQPAVDFILKHKNFVIKGVHKHLKGRALNIELFKFSIGVKRNNITIEDLDSSYAIDFFSGETVPLYIAVPCGKCPNCEMSKRWQHVFKCQLESQCYNSHPWFVTLTYNNDNLPVLKYVNEFRSLDDSGNCCFDTSPVSKTFNFPTLCVRDVQLFLKRLRINLSRMFEGRYNFPIRYVCCGEYGKKGRPHYHLIIWGINTFNAVDYLNVADIIDKSWHKGFIQHRLIIADDDKGFRYTTKYLMKGNIDCHMVDFRQKRPFMNASKGRLGGIGKRFLIENQDYMYRFLDDKLKYFNHFSGKAEDMHFNNWSINSLFPSFTRLVPADVRRAVLELSYYDFLSSNEVFDSCYLKIFSKYIFIPDWNDGVFITPKYTRDECSFILGKWFNKNNISWFDDLDFYLSDAQNKQRLRDKFIIQLTSSQPAVDVQAREYKAIQEHNRMVSLEVVE